MEDVRAYAYIAAAIVVSFGTFGPAMAQGLIGSRACENIGKYPESANNIRFTLIMSMVFPETLSLFAMIIAGAILLLSR
jgi:F-type H+-transporting ATPase subunit c